MKKRSRSAACHKDRQATRRPSQWGSTERRMKEVLVAGLVVLALIGIQIILVLKKISQVLAEIRESLPDKNFRSDTESEYASMRTYWYELRISMNRLARIYDKYVLEKDYPPPR
jgi:hypothetical protein